MNKPFASVQPAIITTHGLPTEQGCCKFCQRQNTPKKCKVQAYYPPADLINDFKYSTPCLLIWRELVPREILSKHTVKDFAKVWLSKSLKGNMHIHAIQCSRGYKKKCFTVNFYLADIPRNQLGGVLSID